MIRHHAAGRARPAAASTRSIAVQLNDTHPALAVAELMRLLVDEHELDWDAAWEITRQTFALHQPHAAARGAREVAAGAVRRLLPRHLEIIYEINRRFLDEVRTRFPGDDARVARMSLIDEDGAQRYVRMAHLAMRRQPPHQRRGRAALASCCAQTCCRDFAELWPERSPT